jgi:hypothetical protein
MRAISKFTRHRPCPPHTPLLIQDSGESYRVARCLACGLQGPKRRDTPKALLAFEEAFPQESR